MQQLQLALSDDDLLRIIILVKEDCARRGIVKDDLLVNLAFAYAEIMKTPEDKKPAGLSYDPLDAIKDAERRKQ